MNQIDAVDLEVATYERGQLTAEMQDQQATAKPPVVRSKWMKSTKSGRSMASTGATSWASIASKSRISADVD